MHMLRRSSMQRKPKLDRSADCGAMCTDRVSPVLLLLFEIVSIDPHADASAEDVNVDKEHALIVLLRQYPLGALERPLFYIHPFTFAQMGIDIDLAPRFQHQLQRLYLLWIYLCRTARLLSDERYRSMRSDDVQKDLRARPDMHKDIARKEREHHAFIPVTPSSRFVDQWQEHLDTSFLQLLGSDELVS